MTSKLYVTWAREAAPHADPRHVLAYMFLEHGTLDGLDRAAFLRSAQSCARAVDLGVDDAEDLAWSYGMVPPAPEEHLQEEEE